MTLLRVEAGAGRMHAFGRAIPCAIGRGGVTPAAAKREGDGATPLGHWPLLGIMLRPDRVQHGRSNLPWRWLRPDDGWSDDVADPAYNRPVRHPHPFSAERLWRADGLYDVIVVLGHNHAPPVAGLGSAIVLHCWNEGGATEGCVAIDKAELVALLPLLAPGDTIGIVV
ncbi:L,D-transpeptidase family protein [Sphingomonas profundi]|uniref:L,D-transpeptidase family protein n=1 Tax=Alterirhizorhabdus profundi TaxID=2681549 RepID=UPI0012E7AAC4|nr:L,D-transpeptidase family protein [Sphingomonas profundi]